MGDSSASSNRVKLRDGRFLAYREGGVAKEEAKYKIILVHGFGGSKDTNFSASIELIQELGVYLLFYDRSGYGESDPNTKRSLQSEADDIVELADQLELGPKFYLIGISMGAYPSWGCLKHIPHRLSGVAFVAPVVNYWWPSLPKELIKKDYRRVILKWGLRMSKYAPGLLQWWIIQKLFPSICSTVLQTNPVYFNSQDKERTGFDTLRDDVTVCFGPWDFEPAKLSITQESCIHIWHGKKDKVIPFQLQRSILQKQPLINYHEIPQVGHMIMHYDGISDAVLRSLLLGE